MSEVRTYVVFVTAPSEAEAARIGRTLVEERLAACANITGQIRSIYRWQDTIEDEPEFLMILKTSADSLDALIARANELHSFEVPEIIALPIHQGFPPYVDWIARNA
ncbi:MAG: divalent-cation tolerance protein CutA [Candidatus Latescibacteria bacterium]|nr:divalent-cation tolerance protein CutA [Candidatus Latescibacterota bacterium]